MNKAFETMATDSEVIQQKANMFCYILTKFSVYQYRHKLS